MRQQIEDVIGLDAHDALEISAKTGKGVEEVLEAIVHRLPRAQGRRQGAAQGAAGRQLVRRLSRRRRAGAHHRRHAEQGPADQADADRRRRIRSIASASSAPSRRCASWLGPGEIGFFTASIRQVADTRVGDTVTDEKKPARSAAARLQAGAAGGVLRPVPGRCVRVRGFARGGRQAPAQRRELHLRDGDLGRARLRLPLRLSRAAASRDHPRAARARVQYRPHRHGAVA